MSPEEIPAALAREGLRALAIVVRPDGTGEVQYAAEAVVPMRHPLIAATLVRKTRYYCDLDLIPTRRTSEIARRRLEKART